MLFNFMKQVIMMSGVPQDVFVQIGSWEVFDWQCHLYRNFLEGKLYQIKEFDFLWSRIKHNKNNMIA